MTWGGGGWASSEGGHVISGKESVVGRGGCRVRVVRWVLRGEG